MTHSLATLSIECAGLLNGLRSLLRDPQCETRSSLTQALVEDQSDRFKIWGGNLGAFQKLPAPSSLDYRLRDSPKIAAQIQEILEDIQDAVNSVFAIASGDQPNRQYDLDNDDDSSDNSANETPNERKDQQILSEAEEQFGSLKESITSLFRMSIIIRKASPRDRFAKAQSAKQSPFVSDFDIAHVGHKYPKLESNNRMWLKERFGKAITQRRQFLRYARDHRDKLAKVMQEEQAPTGGTSKLDFSIPLLNSGAKSQAGQTDKTRPISTLAPTTASTLLLVDATFSQLDNEDNQSHTSYAISTGDDEKSDLKLPRLADVAQGASTFECPFCCTIQSIRKESAWRKHIFTDLRPYLCTFEQCDSKLFADRRDWFEHEMKNHRGRWRCHFCNQTNFHSLAIFQEHLHQHHAQEVTDDQLHALVDASRTPIEGIDALDCPFCVEWEQTLRESNSHISPEGQVLVTPAQFRQHVASHMQALALFAIPRGYLEDDADANSAASVDAAPASLVSVASTNAPGYSVISRSSDYSYATESDSPNKTNKSLSNKNVDLLEWASKQSAKSYTEVLIQTLSTTSLDEIELLHIHLALNAIKESALPKRFAQIVYAISFGRWGSYAYWLSREKTYHRTWWNIGAHILSGKTKAEYESIDKYLQYFNSSLDEITSGWDYIDPSEWFYKSLLNMLAHGKVPSTQSIPTHQLNGEVEALKSFFLIERKDYRDRESIMNHLLFRSNRHLRALNRSYNKNYAPNQLLADLQISFEPEHNPRLLITHILSAAVNPARRDAQFIRECLELEPSFAATFTFGDPDPLAFVLIHIRWSPKHLASVKDEYENCFRQTLEDALVDNLPEDEFRRFCIALVQLDPIQPEPGTGQYSLGKASSEASNQSEIQRHSQDQGGHETNTQVTDPPQDDHLHPSSQQISGADIYHESDEIASSQNPQRYSFSSDRQDDAASVSAPLRHFRDLATKVIFVQRLCKVRQKQRVLQELALPSRNVGEMTLSKDTPLIKELELYVIFQLYPDFFAAVYPHFVIELYQSGQTILKRGTSCPWLCWLVRGCISFHDIDGDQLSTLYPGESFGDIGTLLDEPQPVDIKSKEFCIVVQLRKRDLLSGLRAYPQVRVVLEDIARESYAGLRLHLSKRASARERPRNAYSDERWDIESADEQLFGAKSDHGKNFYTTTIDRSGPEYAARRAQAEKIAREIEEGAANPPVHEKGKEPIEPDSKDGFSDRTSSPK